MLDTEIDDDADLASDIASALDASEKEEPTEHVRDDVTSAWDEAAKEEDSLETKTTELKTGERARGPDGKFVKSESEQTDDARSRHTDLTDQTAKTGEQKAAPSEGVAAQSPEPPSFWAADKKALFSTLPKDAQEYITQLEGERNRFVSQKAEEANRVVREYTGISSVIEPYKQKWALQGHAPESALGVLIQASEAMEQDFLGSVIAMAGNQGVNPEQLAHAIVQRAQGQPQVDPYVHRLTQEVQQLRGFITQQQSATQAQSQEQIHSFIDSFGAEKDEKGAQKYPHFQTVRTTMGRLLPEVVEQNPQLSPKEALVEAYDRAVYARKDIRSQILQREEETRRQKDVAEEKQKAAEAKRASKSISGAPGSGYKRAEPDDIRSQVAAFFGD